MQWHAAVRTSACCRRLACRLFTSACDRGLNMGGLRPACRWGAGAAGGTRALAAPGAAMATPCCLCCPLGSPSSKGSTVSNPPPPPPILCCAACLLEVQAVVPQQAQRGHARRRVCPVEQKVGHLGHGEHGGRACGGGGGGAAGQGVEAGGGTTSEAAAAAPPWGAGASPGPLLSPAEAAFAGMARPLHQTHTPHRQAEATHRRRWPPPRPGAAGPPAPPAAPPRQRCPAGRWPRSRARRAARTLCRAA